MGATGIGAPVRRKEDRRFITGKGHYTDDINRPGQSYAWFLRSPHAHAKIRKIDSVAATAMPGVLAVLTGVDLSADKIGNLICGWDDHLQGRLADEDGAAPGNCPGKSEFCR
jgi:carbon-monoxide dehydrogenase large subunit